MSDKHPCCDLTPNDDCNKTCCPDYRPDSDWCKAFNKRTLEQLKESIQVSIDGMWFNIEDAKNTIAQSEQYLAIIYELLCASLDQVMKVSSSAARTEGDFESASMKIKEYMNEIHQLVGGAQYNGRHLLQDTTTAKRGVHDTEFEVKTHAPYVSLLTTLTVNGAVLNTTDINVDENVDSLNAGDAVFDATNTNIGAVVSASGNTITISQNCNLADDDVITISPYNLTDALIYGDASEREAIHFRLSGQRGACRNVGSIFNDFVFNLPPVGVHSLGLTSFTSKGGKDYHVNGLAEWKDHEGIIGPDGAADDDVDETVSDFNCAIKTIGVELDKLRSYRYILCLREKQVRIYKEGQHKCYEHKCKI